MEEIFLTFDVSLKTLVKRTGHHDRIGYPLTRRAPVKDIIEALGVPHTEVGRICLGTRSVGFGFIPENGQALAIHGVMPPLDVTRPCPLRPRPMPGLRFVVDVNVGKLALWLRMLGLDAAYSPSFSDRMIANLAVREQRVVLTRDAGLLKRRQVTYGRLIRSPHPDDQLREVAALFGLKAPYALFSRCVRCNRPLTPVNKADILHRLEPKTRKYFHEFKQCPACNRIFWRGSHHDDMRTRLGALLGGLHNSVHQAN